MRAIWVEVDGVGEVKPIRAEAGWQPALTTLKVLSAYFIESRDIGQVLVAERVSSSGLVERRRYTVRDFDVAIPLGGVQSARPPIEEPDILEQSGAIWIERKTRYCLAGGVPDWAATDGSWIDGGLHTVEGQVAQSVPDSGGVASAPSLVLRFAYDASRAPLAEVARLARYQYDLARDEDERPLITGYPLAFRGTTDLEIPEIEGLHVIEGEVCYGVGGRVIRAALDTDFSNVLSANVLTSWPALRSARVRVYAAPMHSGSLADARLLFAGYVSDVSMSDDGASLDARATGALSAAAFRASWLNIDSSEPQADGSILVRRRTRSPEYQWAAWGPFAAEVVSEEIDGRDRYVPDEKVYSSEADPPTDGAGIALVGGLDDLDSASITTQRWGIYTSSRGQRSRSGLDAYRSHDLEIIPARVWLHPEPFEEGQVGEDLRRIAVARAIGGGTICHLFRAAQMHRNAPRVGGTRALWYGSYYFNAYMGAVLGDWPIVHIVDALLQILTSTGTGTHAPNDDAYDPSDYSILSPAPGMAGRGWDIAPAAFALGIPADLIDFPSFLDWAEDNPNAYIRDLVAFEDDAGSITDFIENKILQPYSLALVTSSGGLVKLVEVAARSNQPSATYQAGTLLLAQGNNPPRVSWSISETPPAVTAAIKWRDAYQNETSPLHRRRLEVTSDSETRAGGDLFFTRLEARADVLEIDGGIYVPSSLTASLRARLMRDAVPLPLLSFDARGEVWAAEPGDLVRVEDFPVIPAPDGSRGADALLQILSVTRPVIDSVMVRVEARLLDAERLRFARWAPGWRVVGVWGGVFIEERAYSPSGLSDWDTIGTGVVVRLCDEYFTPKSATLHEVQSVNEHGELALVPALSGAAIGDILLPAPIWEQPESVRARWAYVLWESYASEWE